MWNEIGAVTLKTGRAMRICMVKTPNQFHDNNIASFLSHLNELWLWQLDLTIRGKLDELESRFYLGLFEDEIISNVSTWEYRSIGIVGHLFTIKNRRGEGACTALMKAVIHDFYYRGGKVLIGGFNPSSYPIAERLGFKSLVGKSEVMHLDLHPDFERDYFRAERVFFRDTMWKDWPGVSLLFGIKEGWRLRSMKHKIFGPFDYEDSFLEDMKEKIKALTVAKVLTTERGNIVGYATLTSKHRLKDSFLLLDFFVHPSNPNFADSMLKAMKFPKGKIRCFVELDNDEKRDILRRQGFRKKPVQKRIKRDGETVDIIAMEMEF
jgi:hypothetical protein